MMPLDAFCFGNRRTQANRKVVGEMIAANGNGARVAHHSTSIDDQLGGAAADVEQTSAEVALVLSEASFGGSKRLDDRITDQNPSTVSGGDQILRRGNRGSDNVHIGFQPLSNHTDGITNAVVRVHGKFVRKHMKHFAVFRERNVASGVNGAANIFAFNIAWTIAESHAAAAIQSANMAASDSDQR